jgi:hypothetical protein
MSPASTPASARGPRSAPPSSTPEPRSDTFVFGALAVGRRLRQPQLIGSKSEVAIASLSSSCRRRPLHDADRRTARQPWRPSSSITEFIPFTSSCHCSPSICCRHRSSCCNFSISDGDASSPKLHTSPPPKSASPGPRSFGYNLDLATPIRNAAIVKVIPRPVHPAHQSGLC